jgi:predicted lysophospholipase L1 biosynthesis ABC-type transport system permease subunit
MVPLRTPCLFTCPESYNNMINHINRGHNKIQTADSHIFLSKMKQLINQFCHAVQVVYLLAMLLTTDVKKLMKIHLKKI